MAASKPYEQGQQVLVGGGYGYHKGRSPLREGIVEKVGRTLVHVRLSSWEVVAFDMATGRERAENNPRRITTQQAEDDRHEAHETRRRLSTELGIGGHGLATLSLPALRDLERIVRADRAT